MYFCSYIVLFFDPRHYGHTSGNAPPRPHAGSSGAVDTCNRSHRATVPQHRRLARLRARMTSSLGQTVQRFFERQLAPPAALRQSCSDEFERSMSRWLPPNKCDCRKRRNADHPFDPEIAPRRLLFFLSAERVSAGKRWLLGAAGNAVRAEGRRISVPLPRKEMCSTSSPTGWCHCHHDTTSALCRAEPRSVGALDRTPLPVGCLGSEKSTMYTVSGGMPHMQ